MNEYGMMPFFQSPVLRAARFFLFPGSLNSSTFCSFVRSMSISKISSCANERSRAWPIWMLKIGTGVSRSRKRNRRSTKITSEVFLLPKTPTLVAFLCHEILCHRPYWMPLGEFDPYFCLHFAVWWCPRPPRRWEACHGFLCQRAVRALAPHWLRLVKSFEMVNNDIREAVFTSTLPVVQL